MTEPSAGIVPANGPSPRRPSSTGLDRPDASLGLSNPNLIGRISATGNGIENRPSSAPKAAAAATAPIVTEQPAILSGNDTTSSTTRIKSPPFPDGGVIKEKPEGGLITPHRATSATATDTDPDHAAAAAGVAALPGSGVGPEDGSHGEDGNGKGSDSVAAAAKAPGAPGKKKTTAREFPKQFAKALWRIITSTWMNLLLVFVPAGIVVAQIKSLQGPVTFALNCIAIIPLAGLLSFATESVARKMGDAIGALMNITFGNAVELIIFIIALTKDEIRIVQASLLGSILANLLLILGMCFFFGGLRYREQIYNSTVTQMSACLLSLSVISLVLPTAFHASFSDSKKADIQSLKISRGTSIILLLVYMLYLLFQLNSHAYMYESTPQHIVDAESTPGPAANWLDSSSSDDSSDSNTGSDSSYRSRDTVRQKVKKVLRAGRRRKSSVTSVDTQEDGVGVGSSSQSQDQGQGQGQGPRRSTPPVSGSAGFAIGSPVPSAPEEAISEASSSQAGGHHRRRRSSRPINIGPKDEFAAGKDDSEDEDATGHPSRQPHRHRHHHRKHHHHHHHGKKQRKRSRREAGDDAVGGDGQLISPAGSAGGGSNSNGLQIMVEEAGVPRRVDFAVAVPNNANPGAGTAAAGSGSVARRGFPTLRAMSVKNFAPTVFVQKPDTVAAPVVVPVGPVPRVRYGIRRTNSLPDRLNRQIRPPGAVFPAQIPTSAVVRALAGGGGGGGGQGGGVGSRDGPDSIDGAGGSGGEEDEEEISRPIAIGLLLLSTGLVAVCAEFLVGSIREVTSSGAVPEIFIGLIILPIVGNAAEHVTAITVAMKNKMDLAIGVAVGSSIQIALFITPVVVILGWILNHDMTLYFTLFETVCLFVSTFIVNFLVLDGRSNYLEGALLCATYVIISVVAFFYPEGSDASAWGD